MFHIFSLVCFLIYGVKSRSGHDRSQSFRCEVVPMPTVRVSASIVVLDRVPPRGPKAKREPCAPTLTGKNQKHRPNGAAAEGGACVSDHFIS